MSVALQEEEASMSEEDMRRNSLRIALAQRLKQDLLDTQQERLRKLEVRRRQLAIVVIVSNHPVKVVLDTVSPPLLYLCSSRKSSTQNWIVNWNWSRDYVRSTKRRRIS